MRLQFAIAGALLLAPFVAGPSGVPAMSSKGDMPLSVTIPDCGPTCTTLPHLGPTFELQHCIAERNRALASVKLLAAAPTFHWANIFNQIDKRKQAKAAKVTKPKPKAKHRAKKRKKRK